MSNVIDTSSAAAIAILLTFSWGEENVARYTSWESAITIGEEEFAALPAMAVDLKQQHGGTKDQPVEISMTIQPPIDTLTSQRAHAAVRVDIEEVDPSDLLSRRKLFAGEVTQTTRNPDGKTGLVRMQVSGWRKSIALPVQSWFSDTVCQNTFCDHVCGLDREDLQESGEVLGISGNDMEIDGLTTTAVDGYWRAGVVEFDGLALQIREYATGSVVTLKTAPPASWVGQTVTVTPGCDKRIDSCRNKWNNEARFTGFGIKMPAYHPLLEST